VGNGNLTVMEQQGWMALLDEFHLLFYAPQWHLLLDTGLGGYGKYTRF
jgi:hypothetical protein